ncbi:MAG TPA: SCO family protein [Anaerolineales bacterium]|nr:SCO family protein [Anaerolineales bacterium]
MDRKILLVGLFSFLLVGAVAAGVFLFSKPESFRGTMYAEPYPPAPEIELTRDNGTSFRLSEMQGNAVLVFFGYTSCPDVCPTTMAELKQALEQLGEEEAKQARVLFITVDPERDTPERVQEYVDHFNPNFIGLSGQEAELAEVWKDYGVFRQIVQGSSASGYLVDHTARVTLIDQDGNLRLSYAFGTPVEDIVHDLKLLLHSQSSNAS